MPGNVQGRLLCRYLALCSFGVGQRALESGEESIVGGSLLAFAFVFGRCVGAFASLAWMLSK